MVLIKPSSVYVMYLTQYVYVPAGIFLLIAGVKFKATQSVVMLVKSNLATGLFGLSSL